MKKHFGIAAIAALCMINLPVLAGDALPSPQGSSIRPIDKIVAVVNKEIIAQSELDKALNAAKDQIRQRGMTMPDEAQLKKQILQGLIYQKLQLQLAAQNKIDVTDAEVNAAIQNIAKQNKITLQDLKSKLSQEGISFSAFRQQIKDQLIIVTLQRQAVGASLNISNADIAAYKNKLKNESSQAEYQLVDYLVPVSDLDNKTQRDQALARANTLVKDLQSAKSSTPAGVEPNKLGWKVLTDLPDLFAQKVVKMRDGAVSAPLLAGNGYHVIKLIATRSKSSDISNQQVQQMLYQQKFQAALKKWLESIRQQAYIKTYIDN